MRIEELYKDKYVRLWGVDTPEDLATLIARRIEFYALHPIINKFTASLIPPPDRNKLYSKVFPQIAYLVARDKIRYHKEYSGVVRDLGARQAEVLLAPHAVAQSIMEGKPVYGDCDCKTLFLGTLLANRGFPVRLVLARIVKGNKGENIYIPNHIYLEFAYPDEPNKWIPLDAASNRPFGQISSDIIPLKRIYVGTHKIEPVRSIDGLSELPPGTGDIMITIGKLLQTAGLEVKKGELPKKINLIADFFNWLTKPYTIALILFTGGILGWEIYKGLKK
ncbi:MAG: hypothetical protein QXX03_05630 [Nitrososphaerota archaeon]